MSKSQVVKEKSQQKSRKHVTEIEKVHFKNKYFDN